MKLRQFIKEAGAGSLYYAGPLKLWNRQRSAVRTGREVCIFGLHRVLTSEHKTRANSLEGMVMTDTVFEDFLSYLSAHFEILTMQEFFQANTPGSASKPTCLLTFDDGWEDNYTTAFPILKKAGVPAVIFIATGMIGSSETFWVERLSSQWKQEDGRDRIITTANELCGNSGETTLHSVVEILKHMPESKRLALLSLMLFNNVQNSNQWDRMMSWEQIQKMSNSGIDFGGHTVTHPLLPYETDAVVASQICDSKSVLEKKLDKRINFFAYPNGTWDQRVLTVVNQAGFDAAVTTEKGWYQRGTDYFSMKRIMLSDGNVVASDGKFSPAIFNLSLTNLLS